MAKKILALVLAALMLASLVCIGAYAAGDVAYISYNKGNDTYSGRSVTAAKKSLGQPSGKGAISVLKNGGTLVVFEKLYIGGDYTLDANGEITITANYDGTDYKNTEPATNPATGSMKFMGGKTLTVASDLVIDDIILFQEAATNTFVVQSGATLTFTDKVVCMSKTGQYMNIVVEKGGTLIANGGIFGSITGAGDIQIASNVSVASVDNTPDTTPDEPAVAAEDGVVYMAFNQKDDNDGLTPTTAKRTFGKFGQQGVINLLQNGGTLVVVQKGYVGDEYEMPTLGGPLTITAVHGGKDYRNPLPASNPAAGAFKIKTGATMTISSDVIFDNIILFQEDLQNTIAVTGGATLTVKDTCDILSKPGVDYHFKIVVESGSKAILSSKANAAFTIENNGGEVIVEDSAAPQKTEVKLTIGQTTAYVNGEAKTLDVAPVIENSRTLMPLRFIAEAMGATVEWDGATSTATLTEGENVVVITLGSTTATVGGVAKTLDVPAESRNGRTLLPVRFIAESFGAEVAWDGATSTATLTK
ncbi:MAG: copper amine oxidase N-terminal domain-containing protein [Clostridia bacterium]|nr:copper amine oxidase N-terminal domain-containing protein [Clostridia bacterium]